MRLSNKRRCLGYLKESNELISVLLASKLMTMDDKTLLRGVRFGVTVTIAHLLTSIEIYNQKRK